MKTLKRIPWFYFGFSLYPLLALWAKNAPNMQASAIVRPFLLTLIATLLLYLLLYLVMRRNVIEAALIGALVTLLFFSYGHVYDLLRHSVSTTLKAIGRHRILAPAYGGIAIAGTVVLLRFYKPGTEKTKWLLLCLNSIAGILIGMTVTQIGYFYLSSSYRHYQLSAPQSSGSIALSASREQSLPDIYVFVLDGYARGDALQQDLGFDNSAFLKQLEDMGFYIAKCSRPNYVYTMGSVATLLNMEYIPTLRKKYGNTSPALWSFAQYSEVRRRLTELGYKTVAFRTSYARTEILDADVFLGLDQPTLTMQMLSPFESLYVKTTAIRLASDYLHKAQVADAAIHPSEEAGDLELPPDFEYHATLQPFVLDRLLEVPDIEGPKFVFAHILVTHSPYIFAPDGTILTDPGYYGGDNADAINDEYRRRGYIYAMEYLNSRLIPIFQTILRSAPPPIVVVQGDHGFRNQNRFTILNTYYLPKGYEHLYDSITPVNSFRIIFNDYFGENYSLLPDITYDNDGNVVPEMYPSCLP